MASFQKRGENSWLLVVEVGFDAKGKRKRRTKTIKIEDKALLRTTKKLNDYLEMELAKFKIEVESGEYIAPEKMLLKDFFVEWKQKFAKKHLAIKTKNEQTTLIVNHVLPTLNHVRMDRIKPIHIINLLHSLQEDGARKDGKPGGLSDSSIYQVDKALRSLFDRAKEWHIIKESPLKDLKRPRIKKKKMEFLDEVGAYKLLAALNQISWHWRMFFITAMIGGVRRGENIALEWSQVNFKECCIDVVQSIPLFENKKPVIKETKTGDRRRIYMPEWYLEEMELYREEWVKEKDLLGDKWQGEDRQFIFHNGLGRARYPQQATNEWIKFRNKFGFESLRLHDMRHTMVALLIEEGENLKRIQERAGHASSRTTSDIYGHVTRKASKSTAKRFEKFNPACFVNNSSTNV